MIITEYQGRYIDRRAAQSRRRSKVDKQCRKLAGFLNLMTGALMAFVPALLGAPPVPTAIIFIGSICFLIDGTLKIIKER